MSFSKSIASHGQNSCFVAASFTNSAGPKELRHGRGSCGGNAEGRLLTLGPSMDGSGSHNLATDLQPTRKAHSVPVIKCRKAAEGEMTVPALTPGTDSSAARSQPIGTKGNASGATARPGSGRWPSPPVPSAEGRTGAPGGWNAGGIAGPSEAKIRLFHCSQLPAIFQQQSDLRIREVPASTPILHHVAQRSSDAGW
eukprot:CAMPEP_0177565294 /NCGR_PEP_ID=MMETSP0369-20130122/74069_1 /TAXON_ID=447022 ORGANISM="Scrippsiella hangoei-like, Strain SHHI-4" /NCGR_SAMPLE_ID=MMETSP0369 /ASSEMBLY_ACC=CAM_ASM_000364 /LENGTH=196 /DNA_ID=CAMNT_0019052633 /DNA_START=486 /DNA_END=1074 /DNA_ORIENTATION=-